MPARRTPTPRVEVLALPGGLPALYAAARAAVDESRAALATANAARLAARQALPEARRAARAAATQLLQEARTAARETARTWHAAGAVYRERCRFYASVCKGILPLDPTA